MAKKKDQAPLSLPRVKFVVHRKGTMRWDELVPDGILSWFDDNKEEQQKVKDWMAKATHGQKYTVGVNIIFSLEE